MVLRCTLVVGGAPRSDALQAEHVVALIYHAELLARGQHRLQADLALGVLARVEVAGRGVVVRLVAELVSERATGSVATAVRLVEDTNALRWP